MNDWATQKFYDDYRINFNGKHCLFQYNDFVQWFWFLYSIFNEMCTSQKGQIICLSSVGRLNWYEIPLAAFNYRWWSVSGVTRRNSYRIVIFVSQRTVFWSNGLIIIHINGSATVAQCVALAECDMVSECTWDDGAWPFMVFVRPVFALRLYPKALFLQFQSN